MVTAPPRKLAKSHVQVIWHGVIDSSASGSAKSNLPAGCSSCFALCVLPLVQASSVDCKVACRRDFPEGDPGYNDPWQEAMGFITALGPDGALQVLLDADLYIELKSNTFLQPPFGEACC